VEKLAGGQSLSQLAKNLLEAVDPDKIEAQAGRDAPPGRPLEKTDLQSASEKLAKEAASVIATNPDLRNKILAIQRAADQTIDTVSQDKLLFAGADAKTTEAARDTIRSFRDYIEQHKAEIEALEILYSRPFKKRLTEESLRELEAKLKPEFGLQPVPTIWNAYSKVRNPQFGDPPLHRPTVACSHRDRTHNSARTVRRTRSAAIRHLTRREARRWSQFHLRSARLAGKDARLH